MNSNMKLSQNPPIKLRKITITNYKGIDSFSMDFPAPEVSVDPDIMVMGSENGLGKTSIIECCALLLMCLNMKGSRHRLRDRYYSVDVPDLLIRAGAKAAVIKGDVAIRASITRIEVWISRDGTVKIKNDAKHFRTDYERDADDDNFNELIKAICGFSPNPVLTNSFLLFHSYRKVQEGNPELGMMVRNSWVTRRMIPHRRVEVISDFKLLILRSLMSRVGLFEFDEEEESEEIISKLNEMVKTYAGGTISKLRPLAENTVDFRITPVTNGESDASNGSISEKEEIKSVTFDGLSSGQKEIISTLFLIWYYTKDNPQVVFIDEPELHLNVQWHRSFVNYLLKHAPQNQYIIATHSEDIMDSVYKERRVLLTNDKVNIHD